MKIAIRVDLSKSIGTGHLLRCRPLIERLTERDATACWIYRTSDLDPSIFLNAKDQLLSISVEDTFSQIESKEWFKNYNWQLDAEQTWKHLEQNGVEVLLVDHYAIDARWVSFLKRKNHALKIIFIDDLANRSLNSDVVIDPNLRHEGYGIYDSLIKHGTRVFGGPRFNPLICKQDLVKVRNERSRVTTMRQTQKVLLFFGGTDQIGATRLILRSLLSQEWPGVQFSVVTGAANVDRAEISKMIEGHHGFEVFDFVEHWADFMSEFDYAIGAAGTSAWERAFIGLPSIVFAISDNQILVGEELETAEAAIYLGTFAEGKAEKVVVALKDWIQNPEKAEQKRKNGRQLWTETKNGMDEPLLQIFLQEKKISFEKAGEEHCQILFDWRNDPTTRKNSIQRNEISFSEHSEWFKSSLKNPNRKIYLARLGNAEIGMARFDLGDRGWELSWSVAPAWRGQGVGKELVKQATELVNHNLWAKILIENLSSMRVAESAGFEKIEQSESLSYWQLKKGN